MKKMNLKLSGLSFLALLAVSVCFTSCEKDAETLYEAPTSVADTDGLAEEETDLIATSVLQMSAEEGLTEEENNAKWERAVSDYMKSVEHDRLTNSFAFEVRTVTGTDPGDGTNAVVTLRLTVDTNTGRRNASGDMGNRFSLRNTGADDRELFIVSDIPFANCVGLRRGRVRLQGTDGWDLRRFEVRMRSNEQPGSLSGGSVNGFSSIIRAPGIFLDNNLPNNWDTFNTGAVGTGDICWN